MVKRRKPADDTEDDEDGWGGGFAAKRPNAGFTMMSTQPVTNGFGTHVEKAEDSDVGKGDDAEEEEEENLTFSFMPKKKAEDDKDRMDRRRAELHHTLVALNTQFRAWVNRRFDESDGGKYEFWGLGVRSYLEHEQKLRDDFKDVLSAAGVTGSAPRAPGALNASASPFMSSKSTLAAAAAAAPPPPLFGGAASKSPAAASSPPAAFTPTSTADRSKDGEGGSAPKPALVNPVSAAGGLFGNLKGGMPPLGSFPATTTALPTFGSGTTSAAAPSLFASTAPVASVAAATGGTEEEDPPRPPSPSVADGDDNVVVHFTSKAKMFLKSDGEWKDLGVGVLSVRSEKDGEPKPRICLRNSGGKLRLNSNIYKGIKVSVQKNTVTAQLQYSASDDAEPKLEIILLRLKTPELCKDLADAIDKQAHE